MIREYLRLIQLRFPAVLILVIFHQQASGQVIGFEQIGLEEGLSQISVMNITQDQYGSIWLGTRNGLNRYDGKTVTTYLTSKNGNSIIENQIQGLRTQGSLLWISTPNSISRLDLRTEIFTNYPLPQISAFFVDGESVWVAAQNELLKHDPILDSFIGAEIALGEGTVINSFAKYGNDLLVGSSTGIWQIKNDGLAKVIPGNYHVRCMYVDSKMNLWVGTNYQGLLKIHDGLVLSHFRSPAISNNFVRCVQEDEDGKIWVGTFTGLDVIHPSGSILHYKNNKSIQSSLSHNSVWSLFKDREGAMWVGTYFGGVNIFHPTQRIYNFYPENRQSNQSINFRVVGQVLEDDDQNLWICTDGGGLNYFDRSTGLFDYFKFDPTVNSISGNNVKSICLQGDSILWIGTHRGGLNRLDLATKKFELFRLEGTSLDPITAPEIRSIAEYGQDLLLGTSNGLVLFDRSEQTFKPFLREKHSLNTKSILAIVHSDENDLWIGTERSGLFKYSIESGEVQNYRSEINASTRLPSNTIYAIHKDHMNRYWIGTSNGLCQYIPDEDHFAIYGIEDGLVGNVVFGIVESRYSGLVVQTNKGINFFKPHNKSFRSITFANGLPLRELSHNGIYSSDDGNLFVSGIGGFVEFRESDFLAIQPTSSPMITSISVNNERINPSTHGDIISTTIMESPKVNLRHQHSTITFSVSDMSFTKASRQGLEYRLKGLDDEWIKAEEKSEITYTNLDNGNYTFLLRSIN
ncbi:MAG: two-component regulator propeller domain-containing protein, partial [Bacteroidota bacterium]